MAIDFFARQDHAKQQSSLLITLFILAVIGLVVSVYLIVWGVVGLVSPMEFSKTLWHPKIILAVVAGVSLIVFCGSAMRMMELSAGGRAVANILGATPVSVHTDDPKLRMLVNVVEEMSIASGVAVPQIYFLSGEDGINACAAGHSIEDSAIIVTQGSLDCLTRDELQGVIAHEFSHILNGDMNINMQLLGLVFGLTCIAEFGWLIMQFTPGPYDDNDDAKVMLPIVAVGIGLVALGWLGVFFGNIVQAAVSRQREYLADASAVQFTRSSDGIAGALKKIAGYTKGSELRRNGARQVDYFFFGSSKAKPLFFDAFATHPPLADRIKVLDPSFDLRLLPEFSSPPLQTMMTNNQTAGFASNHATRAVASFENHQQPTALTATAQESNQTSKQTSSPPPLPSKNNRLVLASTGRGLMQALHGDGEEIDQASIDKASILKAGLPENLLRASRELVGGCALVLALLVSKDEDVKQRQYLSLLGTVNQFVYNEMNKLLPAVTALAPEMKLPLLSMTMPTLRQLSEAQYEQFRRSMNLLIQADNKLDLFEYAVQKIVSRNLDNFFNLARVPQVRYRNIAELNKEISVVLSAVAHLDANDPMEAFVTGAKKLEIPLNQLTLLTEDECALEFMESALERLSLSTRAIKKSLLDAVGVVVMHDSQYSEEEQQLARALAEALGCPVPLSAHTGVR